MSSSARRTLKSVHSREQQLLREVLIEIRHKAQLSQQELADRLRAHQSFVSKYETGERRLDVVEFVRIVTALGADPLKVLRRFVDLIA